MKRYIIAFVCAVFLIGLYSNCTGGFQAASSSVSAAFSNGSVYVPPGQNTMSVSIGCGYVNEPCVSVTICAPGSTTNCQTINNILLDTGSYGLRLYNSVVTVPLNGTTDASGRALAECVSYADGTGEWGPVKTADVVLGSETAPSVPIQIIDPSYGTRPTSCDNADSTADADGFNGILGVGLFTEDCGATCASSANVGIYYGCVGTSCSGTAVPIAAQVSNPVSFLPASNNGVILTLPAISASGADGVTGTLTFGISTQADNTPGSVTTFGADSDGNMLTTYGGTSYSAFIDSGSNGYYFPSSITKCTSSGYTDFYCPASTTTYSATQMGASSAPSLGVNFQIANTQTLIASNHESFNDFGGTMTGSFDWGLPFFFGRSVYVGIDGKASGLGTGPYWSY